MNRTPARLRTIALVVTTLVVAGLGSYALINWPTGGVDAPSEVSAAFCENDGSFQDVVDAHPDLIDNAAEDSGGLEVWVYFRDVCGPKFDKARGEYMNALPASERDPEPTLSPSPTPKSALENIRSEPGPNYSVDDDDEPDGWVGSDAYCAAALDVATNAGTKDYLMDYTEEEIRQAGEDYDRYC